MSIPVAPDELPAVLARFRSAVLVTAARDDWPRVVTVDPVAEDGLLRVPCDFDSVLRRVDADPHVTLVWQPVERHGWTLVVDGLARREGDGLAVTVDHAVLHRPRAHADGPSWDGPRAE